MTATLDPALRAGLLELELALEQRQITALLDYLELIRKWNRTYNLTAVRDPQDMLRQHLLDSLAVIRPLRQQTGGSPCSLLDVGAGAGLPGVVIAVCCPEIRVECVDAVAKKAAFVQQTAAALRLANLRGLHHRVEQLAGAYDVISSRAFASLADFVTWSAAALAPHGIWMAMKGRHPADEIKALPPMATVFHVEQLHVPGLEAERCVVWMRRAAEQGGSVT